MASLWRLIHELQVLQVVTELLRVSAWVGTVVMLVAICVGLLALALWAKDRTRHHAKGGNGAPDVLTDPAPKLTVYALAGIGVALFLALCAFLVGLITFMFVTAG